MALKALIVIFILTWVGLSVAQDQPKSNEILSNYNSASSNQRPKRIQRLALPLALPIYYRLRRDLSAGQSGINHRIKEYSKGGMIAGHPQRFMIENI